jgi:hypothetical protein
VVTLDLGVPNPLSRYGTTHLYGKESSVGTSNIELKYRRKLEEEKSDSAVADGQV